MRKIALALIALMMMSGTALALDFDSKSFYVHGLFSLPMGTFGDVAGNGFGGGVGMTVPHNDQLNFRAEAGYVMYGGQDFGAASYSYSQIPIVVLAEYQFSYDTPFYGVGGLGMYMMRWTWEHDTQANQTYSSSDIGLTFGGGYRVNEQINVEGRLTTANGNNQLWICGMYNF